MNLLFIEQHISIGMLADIGGLAVRLKGNSFENNRNRVLHFILTEKQMWHDVGNTDPYPQSQEFKKGINPLYLDKEHKQLNPNVIAGDYLLVFKAYMQRWAARKNEGSDSANWFKMQDELADQISSHTGREQAVA